MTATHRRMQVCLIQTFQVAGRGPGPALLTWATQRMSAEVGHFAILCRIFPVHFSHLFQQMVFSIKNIT